MGRCDSIAAQGTSLNASRKAGHVQLVEGRCHIGKVMVQPSDCPTCSKTLDAGLA